MMDDTINPETSGAQDGDLGKHFFITQTDRKDGWAEISVEPKGLRATAILYPPAVDGSPLSYNTVIARLQESGIINGVKAEEISDVLMRILQERVVVRDFVIAECEPPISEIPLHYTVRPELQRTMFQSLRNTDARIDWKSITSFIIVKKDELIAECHPRVAGKNGKNIYGREVSFETVQKKVYTAGKNVRQNSDGIFADQAGHLTIQESGTIIVEDSLVLKTGINNETGSIAFPRDVICSGPIEDGFKLFTGGSFMSTEVVDATEIVCKKDFITKSGIIGRLKGTVKVSGSLTAQFIQSCRVAVKEDCLVANSIIKSTVYSLKKIHMSDQGKIVGGECWAVDGIVTGVVGNQAELPTVLVCGINFIVKQERDRLNNQLLQLTMLINQIKSGENPNAPHLAQRLAELERIKENITKKIAETMAKDMYHQNAEIIVTDTVYPGTTITICDVSYYVVKKMNKVKFRLDPQANMILTEEVKKATGASAK